MFVEIACPADVSILAKEDEKILKYQGLAREVSTGYNQPVDIIPVVFGHSGGDVLSSSNPSEEVAVVY